MRSPDDYVALCVGDLSQEQYDALEQIWPAAFDAVTGLLADIEAGRQCERTSDLDVTLATLIAERMPADGGGPSADGRAPA